MKKVKAEKSTLPISVSAKKSGPLKHQMLFTPYKIEWKNIQPTPASQTSSRTFFNTMKNDLSNLKNDVEKMIKKEGLKSDSKYSKIKVLGDSSNCKNDQHNKLYSSSSKLNNLRDFGLETTNFEVKQPPHINIENVNSEEHQFLQIDLQKSQKQLKQMQIQIDSLLKQNRIQKTLITELKKQNHELYTEIQQKTKIQLELGRDLNQEKESRSAQIEELTLTIENLKTRVSELENEIQNQKLKSAGLSEKIQSSGKLHESQVEDLRSHNSFLEQKIQGLSDKMSIASGKFQQRQLYIKQLETKLEAIKISKRQIQIQQQYEKNQLNEEWKKKFELKEKEFQTKLQEQLKISQTQFMEQIEYIQARTKEAVQGLEEENLQFSEKIKQLEQQLKEFELANREEGNGLVKREDEPNNNVNFGLLGAEFERKINELVQENYQLKNKTTQLQSQIQSLLIEKGSLLEQIKLYEQIETQQKETKTASSTELQKVILELHDLRREKDIMAEEFQFKIIKLENELQQQKNTKPQKSDDNSAVVGSNFNKILKDQLQENQDLKQKLREQVRELQSVQNSLKQQQQKFEVLKQELSIERMKIALEGKKCKDDMQQSSTNQEAINSLKRDLQLLKKKYEALNSMLDAKNKQIKTKDEFIEKVLISKIGKKEDEDEIAYILKQLKLFSPQNC